MTSMQTLTLDQILPVGVTLLAGRPKSGKTSLALGITLAVAAGSPVLGRLPTEASEALYLALETWPLDFLERLRQMRGKQASDGLTWATQWPRLDEGGLVALADWHHLVGGPGLVVIDSLSPLLRGPGFGERLFAQEGKAVGQLAELARKRALRILVTRHVHNIEADGTLRTPAGSPILLGMSDATWLLRRDGDSAELAVSGRGTPSHDLPLTWDAEHLQWRA